ncbi:MAG: Magnesium transporter MgtE [Gammaproteobacteria bacterium]|nr:Magnesium transporter MgtE [Gammaproteobacteria bacterium]
MPNAPAIQWRVGKIERDDPGRGVANVAASVQEELKHPRDVRVTLEEIEELLNKQEAASELTARQETPRHEMVMDLLLRQQHVDVERRLQESHPADIAYVLEGLPLERRRLVWSLVRPEARGAVLLELSEAVREGLLGGMPSREIVDAAEHLDSDEIADLVPSLPRDTVFELFNSLDGKDRAELQDVLSFPEGSVGALMDLDVLSVRDDVEIEVVLRYLRKRKDLPEQIDQIIVVDRAGVLKGVLPVKRLLIHDPEAMVGDVMLLEPVSFRTDESARDAAQAFERYDLRTAPVINIHNQVVGVLSVDQVMDYVNESAQRERLSLVGLREDEDLFGSVWKSSRNRWTWLILNLMTAFIASRVIGLFEGTIERLVALAALMPIVASVAGNSGNQTVALVIRGLALNQVNTGNFYRLLFKEIGISLVNGLVWGSVVGFFAYLFYNKVSLAVVMVAAMILNLLMGALAGVIFPLTLHKLGRDPVMGSSVMLTAITDSMGFFIFLGLAAAFLR